MPYCTAEQWDNIQNRFKNADQKVPPDPSKLRRDLLDEIELVSGYVVRDFVESIEQIAESQNPFPGATLQIYCSVYFLPSRPIFERLLEDFDGSANYTNGDSDYLAQHFASVVAVTFGLNAIGVVRSMDSRHNFNFAVVHPLELIWFEPKNRLILKENQLGKGQYKIPGLASFSL